MARTKRSVSQQNTRRPYDQSADAAPRVQHSRLYDQSQEQTGRSAAGYGAEPELLTRRTAHTGMQEVGFTIPVHRSAASQPVQPQAQHTEPSAAQKQGAKKPAVRKTAKKKAAANRRAAQRVQEQPRPVQHRYEDDDDAPLPTTLRQRGQAAKRRAKRRRALFLSILVVLLVGIWVLIAFVFKISEIKVAGSSVYTQSVLTESFGYRPGDNLFTFSRRKTAEKMLSALPYLETVSIRRQLPGTVRIEVTASEEKYCFVQPDGSTVITSPSYKVLRLGSNSGGLLSIRGVNFAAPVPGKPLAPQTEEDTALQTLDEVLKALEAGHIKQYTVLDVSDPYAITLKCEERFILQLGTTVELDYKLRLAAKTIYDQLEADATGIVDVSGAGTSHAAYYRPQAVD